MSTEPDLYEYLRKECPTLEAAKVWIRLWANDWDQKLPWETSCTYTVRAMSGHLSNVLEGGTLNTGYALGNMVYFDTKFGSELMHAAWSNPFTP